MSGALAKSNTVLQQKPTRITLGNSENKGTLMNRSFIFFILLNLYPGSGLLQTTNAQVPNRQKPNIIYILTDQWRASATGYAGDPNVKTPHIDALVKSSLNFKNAVSVTPVCTPHRAALMTGRYPTSTGVFLNDVHLPDEELCIAEVFGKAGYNTGYIGKWHLDGNGRFSYIPVEKRQGFDYWKAAECDHDYNHSHYYTGLSNVKMFWNGYDVFDQTKDAQQYIRTQAKSNKPIILFVAFGAPHFPHQTAPKEYLDMYDENTISLPSNVPKSLRQEAKKEAKGYYAHCSAIDKSIGDILATIDDAGIKENTIFIFTSDHGEMLGSQGVRPKTKQVPFGESARVPFLLRYPPVTGNMGRLVQMPVTTPDIFPTLLGLAKIPIPKACEGNDLSSFIFRKQDDLHRAVLYMNISPFIKQEFAIAYRAIKTYQYTYVRSIHGPWFLFDDISDPFQMTNLLTDKSYYKLSKKLDTRLHKLLKRNDDEFQPGSFYLAKWGFHTDSNGSIPYSGDNIYQQTPRIN